MKKTKTLTKKYDNDKTIYYDNALYEHDHKENSKTDLILNKKYNVHKKNVEGAIKLLQNGVILH